MTRRFHAFTLVELLVVIAIIGLLIGLLLPALSAAKTASYTSVGLANLRSCFQAIYLYASDNKDSFPKPFSMNATFKGSFFAAGQSTVLSTASDATVGFPTVQTVGGVQLPMVGFAELWCDPIWNGGYITGPKILSDPGKLPQVDCSGGASTIGMLKIDPSGKTPAFRNHDPVTGAVVAAYQTTGMGVSYLPSLIFRCGSMGAAVTSTPGMRYYDWSPTGKTMKISTRPYPAENMALKDSNQGNFPWGYSVAYYSYNTVPYRNSAQADRFSGTTASVYFDGHAGIVKNIDITAFIAAGPPLNAFPQYRSAPGPDGSRWPDPLLYPNYIGARYYDVRNFNPLGPTDTNGNAGIDNQNILVGDVSP